MNNTSTTDTIKNTANNFQNKASEMVDEAIDASKSVNKVICDAASDMYEQGRSKLNDIESTVMTYSEDAIKTVQEKPLSAILIAAAVGFLLSKLFSSSK